MLVEFSGIGVLMGVAVCRAGSRYGGGGLWVKTENPHLRSESVLYDWLGAARSDAKHITEYHSGDRPGPPSLTRSHSDGHLGPRA